MSRWNDLFEEPPPPQHLESVMRKADPLLKVASQKSRRKFLTQWLVGGLATGLAGLMGIILYQRNQAENLQLSQFVDFEPQDLELVADHEFDLEILENLDLLEEEDV